MSNEYKEWVADKVVEVLEDAHLIDRATQVWPSKLDTSLVCGYCGEEEVEYDVWFSMTDECWKWERRK